MQEVNIKQQAVFNYAAVRLAVNIRKNIRHLPPEVQADFLAMTDYVRNEVQHEKDGDKNRHRAGEDVGVGNRPD